MFFGLSIIPLSIILSVFNGLISDKVESIKELINDFDDDVDELPSTCCMYEACCFRYVYCCEVNCLFVSFV